jgi:hypothetical protein
MWNNDVAARNRARDGTNRRESSQGGRTMLTSHRRGARRAGPSTIAAMAMLALTTTLAWSVAPPVASGASTTLVGTYSGKTTPVWFALGAHGLHQSTIMNLSIVRASFSSCGGPKGSRVTVVCLTSGNVDIQGDVVNFANAAPWSTTPYAVCSSFDSVWQPAYRVPASGRISEHYTILSHPGVANSSPVEKVSATIQVLANGTITGTIRLQVFISGPATGQKWEPYCSSGNVSFHLHRI